MFPASLPFWSPLASAWVLCYPLRLLRLCGAAKVLLAGADGYKAGTAAYADAGLHTHTGRGAAYNAQMAGAIRASGLPVAFITPSEYERA